MSAPEDDRGGPAPRGDEDDVEDAVLVDAEPVEDEAGPAPSAGPAEEEPKGRRSLLKRASRRARSVARRIRDNPDIDVNVGRARSLLSRVANKARDTVSNLPVDDAAERVMKALSDPRAVAVMQRSMSTIGGRGMEAAFKREPAARLLFDFAEWCEQEADRGDVMAVLLNDAMAPDGAFALMSKPLDDLGLTDDPLRAVLSAQPTGALVEVFEAAQVGLLLTLCRMAALGAGVEPPQSGTPLAELVAFFKDADIPERFHRLADLALGKDQREPAEAPEHGDADDAAAEAPEVKQTALARVKRMLPTRSMPPGFRFLVGTYLVFLHSYLTRNMVDAFPRVMEKVREEIEEGERARQQKDADPGEVLDMGDGGEGDEVELEPTPGEGDDATDAGGGGRH